MTQHSSLIYLAALLLLQLAQPALAQQCNLCGDAGVGGLAFPNVRPQGSSKSCALLAVDTAKFQQGSGMCTSNVARFRQACCSGKMPQGGTTPPPGLPGQNIPTTQYVGPHPACNICRDGDYPFATSMVINFLYIGEGSCAQYYRYGKEGRIAQHMCDPVKFFAYEPCGCGEFNPYFNKQHPMNQQAQQAPSQNNSGGNSGNHGGGNSQTPTRKTPSDDGDKSGQSVREGRGGAGGGRRALKGTQQDDVDEARVVITV